MINERIQLGRWRRAPLFRKPGAANATHPSGTIRPASADIRPAGETRSARTGPGSGRIGQP